MRDHLWDKWWTTWVFYFVTFVFVLFFTWIHFLKICVTRYCEMVSVVVCLTRFFLEAFDEKILHNLIQVFFITVQIL